MTRALLLPGWGFSVGVFDSLCAALGNGFVCDGMDKAARDDGGAIPAAVAEQIDAADVLIGWSLGGLQALQLALQAPERVSRLVLLAATPCFTERADWDAGMPAEVFRGFRQQLHEDARAAMQQFVRLNAGSRPSADMRRRLSDHMVEPEPVALMTGMDVLANTDLRDNIPAVQARVLILQALDDRLVSPLAGRWLSDRLPDARLVEFATGGHAFFLGRPDIVAGEIFQWL